MEHSEVCPHDRGRNSPIHTYGELITCLLYGKQGQFNWFVLADISLANSNGLHLILRKFASHLYFIFYQAF